MEPERGSLMYMNPSFSKRGQLAFTVNNIFRTVLLSLLLSICTQYCIGMRLLFYMAYLPVVVVFSLFLEND